MKQRNYLIEEFYEKRRETRTLRKKVWKAKLKPSPSPKVILRKAKQD